MSFTTWKYSCCIVRVYRRQWAIEISFSVVIGMSLLIAGFDGLGNGLTGTEGPTCC